MSRHESLTIEGPAGAIEVVLSVPEEPTGLGVVAHPHPLFGGSMTNKVVTTIARTLVERGDACARFNFRGVGKSAGIHDEGRGETVDFLHVLEHLQVRFPGLPVTLSGFSFGGAVALHASEQVECQAMLLVAPAFKRLPALGSQGGRPPGNTLVLHGDQDDTVPLVESLAWASPRDIPVLVAAGADHFFHARLHHVKNAVRILSSGLVTRDIAPTEPSPT
jgi:uncharacterized protein